MASHDDSGRGAEPIADINRIVHQPARLLIMASLYVVEGGDYTYLMRRTDLTWGNLSSHLSKLEEAGYVEIEKEFVDRKPHTMVRLSEEGRDAFVEYRRSMERVFSRGPD